jgi:cytoskeletal protein CcmA (bactofilin family)
VLQSTLEPKSERQESRATFVSVVTPRLNPNTATASVREKTLAEEPAAPGFLRAPKETNDSENSGGPVQATASEPAVNDALFDPVAPFGEWLQALEDFRKRPQTGSRPSVYLADGDPHFAEPLSLDDQFPDAIRSEGTLVVTEYGTIEADVEVTVAVIDGVFKGKIAATEQVILKNHALVIGNIYTPALNISGGAIIEGQCYFQQIEQHFEPQIEVTPEEWERPGWQDFEAGFAKVWPGRIFQ